MKKTAAVIGYGKSGASAHKLLLNKGYEVALFDDKKDDCLPLAEYKDIYDLTVMSPGVMFSKLQELPHFFTSELELAYKEMLPTQRIVGITGTNGKSTVTHLTAQLLNLSGQHAIACGNIGYPFIDALSEAKTDTVFVIEISSFQLDLLRDFRIDAASITNITPDHLDRYGEMESYIKSKLHILDFIPESGLLVADSDSAIISAVSDAHYSVNFIGNDFTGYPRLRDNVLNMGTYYANISKYKLFGHHNLLNLIHALALTNAIKDLQGDVTSYVEHLGGLPHRTELVGVFGGIRWINDSKATNVDSTLTALKSCGRNTVVFLGGRDKKGDFTALAPELNRCAKAVIYFGEAADVIEKQLSNLIQCKQMKADTLKSAIELVKEITVKGDVALLSPACASFDEFKSYGDRGEKFAQYVKEVYK